jgi:hypothetical protein
VGLGRGENKNNKKSNYTKNKKKEKLMETTTHEAPKIGDSIDLFGHITESGLNCWWHNTTVEDARQYVTLTLSPARIISINNKSDCFNLLADETTINVEIKDSGYLGEKYIMKRGEIVRIKGKIIKSPEGLDGVWTIEVHEFYPKPLRHLYYD